MMRAALKRARHGASSGPSQTLRRARGRREDGTVAIEFALVFPVFFMIFYGLVTWGLIFMLQQLMTLAAADGARAAVAVALLPTDPGYDSLVETQARSAAGDVLDWLPDAWKAHLDVRAEIEGSPKRVVVRVSYPDYKTAPILPLLTLPGLGAVPPVPEELNARAEIRL